MGTSHSSRELSAKLVAFGAVGVPAAMRAGVLKVCQKGQRDLATTLAAERALKWRNMRRGTSGARYRIYESSGASKGTLWVFGAPAYIANEGTPDKPDGWLIVSRSNRQRAAKVGKRGPSARAQAQASVLFGFLAGQGGGGQVNGYLNIPGIGVRRSAHHKTLHGRHFFGPVATVIEAQAPAIAQAEVAKELAKAFR